MTSSIKVKVGVVEDEFEGSEDFIQNGLLTFVETLASFISGDAMNNPHTQLIQNAEFDSVQDDKPQKTASIEGTTNTLAARLKVTSGTELIMAAAAHLTFVKGQDRFHRKVLLEQCQSAATYYKQSYSSNFTKYLASLVRNGQLTEQANDVYAIPAAQRQRMELTLVD